MIVTKELISTDMSCNHCKMNIEKAVKDLDGIAKVNADPTTKKVLVEFDESSTTIEEIKHAIEEAGYSAEVEADTMA
jgi:copper chaperone